MSDTRENDLVERLKYLASGSQLWEAGELSGIFRQSFTLIERLQKELGEARQLLGEAQVYCPHYPPDGLGNRIFKAIRSMDGGGK